MALAPLVSLLVFSFLVLCNVSSGQIEQQSHPFGTQGSQRRFREQSQCQVQRLEALEPKERIESEAGVTELWDENNKQFECAGVAALRHRIDSQGLLLPTYENAPKLIYIVQGRGFFGAVLPGCPESFQSIRASQQREQEQRQRYQDQHQKIRQFRQGDIIAVPAGVPTWCYNDGETPVVAVEIIDTSNSANQLDQNFRRFHLAGNPKSPSGSSYERDPTQRKRSGSNVFSGFDVETLAEAFGVSTETARKLQSQGDSRGNIVHVENGLQVVRPPSRREEQEEGQGEEEEQKQRHDNGLEETLCHMRLKENIADPEQADVYSPNGGRITSLNSQKLPILNYLQLSAERGVLYKNAILAPQWNINAHSVVYCTSGNGRIQIVGDYGRPVYDGELKRGQLVIVPQNFAVVKQAGNQGFEWIAFKTSNNAMTSPLVGRASALRGMPEAVLMNSYKISREEARRLKNNRGQETVIFAPRTQTQGRAFA